MNFTCYCVPYDGSDGNRKIKAPSACGYWGRKYGIQCIKATGSAALDNSNEQGCFAIA